MEVKFLLVSGRLYMPSYINYIKERYNHDNIIYVCTDYKQKKSELRYCEEEGKGIIDINNEKILLKSINNLCFFGNNVKESYKLKDFVKNYYISDYRGLFIENKPLYDSIYTYRNYATILNNTNTQVLYIPDILELSNDVNYINNFKKELKDNFGLENFEKKIIFIPYYIKSLDNISFAILFFNNNDHTIYYYFYHDDMFSVYNNNLLYNTICNLCNVEPMELNKNSRTLNITDNKYTYLCYYARKSIKLDNNNYKTILNRHYYTNDKLIDGKLPIDIEKKIMYQSFGVGKLYTEDIPRKSFFIRMHQNIWHKNTFF